MPLALPKASREPNSTAARCLDIARLELAKLLQEPVTTNTLKDQLAREPIRAERVAAVVINLEASNSVPIIFLAPAIARANHSGPDLDTLD